ncbi:MAG: hypothetical protein LBH82_01490 [Bacteroidales bacterium]|nr:hypothetical protein [Bacteroidales bacterium]
MKKYIYIFIIGLLVLGGCKKEPTFTQKQVSAFFTLTGEFQAYSDQVILAVISFQTRYAAPQIPSGDDVELHGECAFFDSHYDISEQGSIACYYAISDDADEIFFYHKGGNANKKLIRSYKMNIQNEDNVSLSNGGRVLRFERVKL